jgi:hypothetical protein
LPDVLVFAWACLIKDATRFAVELEMWPTWVATPTVAHRAYIENLPNMTLQPMRPWFNGSLPPAIPVNVTIGSDDGKNN